MDKLLNFNIDKYLDPVVPPSPLKKLPTPVSRWFGYRSGEYKEPAALVIHFFATLGSLVALLVIGAVYKYAPGISQYSPPALIASLGASTVLEYAAIQTPLSQPRNALIGHILSAVIGVAISKGFQTHADFANLQWIAGAVACAVSTLVMSLTNTIHPPGGATAVLACVSPEIVAMGWTFVPVIIVALCLMLGVSLLNNNIARRWPVYWWSSGEVGQAYKKPKHQDEETQSEIGSEHSDLTLNQLTSNRWRASSDGIHISASYLQLPQDMDLREEEMAILRELQLRLHK